MSQDDDAADAGAPAHDDDDDDDDDADDGADHAAGHDHGDSCSYVHHVYVFASDTMYAITAAAVRGQCAKYSPFRSLRLGRQLPSAAFSHIQQTSRAPRASRDENTFGLFFKC